MAMEICNTHAEQETIVSRFGALMHENASTLELPVYRIYRSLGTPPRLTFQARLLLNQEDVNTDRYV